MFVAEPTNQVKCHVTGTNKTRGTPAKSLGAEANVSEQAITHR